MSWRHLPRRPEPEMRNQSGGIEHPPACTFAASCESSWGCARARTDSGVDLRACRRRLGRQGQAPGPISNPHPHAAGFLGARLVARSMDRQNPPQQPSRRSATLRQLRPGKTFPGFSRRGLARGHPNRAGHQGIVDGNPQRQPRRDRIHSTGILQHRIHHALSIDGGRGRGSPESRRRRLALRRDGSFEGSGREPGPDEFTETVQAAPPGKAFFDYYTAKFARVPPPAKTTPAP